MPHEVVQVAPLGGTRLLLTFSSGERRLVDVASIVTFDGVFAPLTDPEFFRLVTVNPELGTVAWPNGADLCPDVLYARGLATEAA